MKFSIVLGFFTLCSIIFTCQSQSLFKQHLIVGQSVKLKCGPIDRYYNIPFMFKWEKPPGNVIGTEPELELKNIDFRDGGIYTCRVSQMLNNKLVEKSLSTELFVERRDTDPEPRPRLPIDEPVIQFKDVINDVLDLQETDYLYTNCMVANWARSDYTTQWLFNQNPINGANHILFKSPLDSNKDVGYYTCRIKHKDYPDRTFEKQLLVNIKMPEIIVTSLPEESLKIGGRIYRRCEVKSGKYSNDPLQFIWMKDGSIEISTGPVLDISISDASVNGDYSCVVKSTKLNKMYTKESPIKIDSRNVPDFSQHEIVIVSTPTYPRLNMEYSLRCEVRPEIGNINYRWKKDETVITNGQTYTIPNFKVKDIGSYSCEIVNTAGQVMTVGRQSSGNIVARLETESKKIELDESGAHLTTRTGDRTEMHCEIPPSSNIRAAHVQWLFNGLPFTNDMKRQYNIIRSDRASVSILSLLYITPKNRGQYICKYDNFVKKVNLMVVEEIAALTISPERMVKNEGEPVEFHCQGGNIPDFSNTQIRWGFRSRDGRVIIPYYDNNRRWEVTNSPETPETSFLSIPSCKYQDDGFYTCTAQNGMQKTAELVVKRREDGVILTITPEISRVREGQPVVVECFSVSQRTGEPYGEPKFTLESGRQIEGDPRIVEQVVGKSRIRLLIKDGLQTSDSKLKIECHSGIETKTAMIYLENQCQPNFRRCSNGDCLQSGKFCDGVADCSDGSDENQALCNKCDPLVLKCGNHLNKSPLKSTFVVNWLCDGENDCGNNFDESKCNEQDWNCGNVKFNCSNGKVIPRAYRCDKEMDCPSGEDEIGCSLPQIITGTGDKVKRVRRGDSIELTCESYGVPQPYILWRHNWGCLKDEYRIKATKRVENCFKVISTLRITNFQSGDDGIYNCEILSGQNRGFSDDYQLIMAN